MKALRLLEWKSEPELVEVAKPTPGPGQAVVKVGGAGACHSDLHLMHDFEAGMLPWQLPFTLGHENAGWIDAVGDGVTAVSEGDAVAVYGSWGCGKCSRCQLGVENYCENPAEAPVFSGGGGLGLDGGMAEYLLVPAERNLIRLPDGLEPETAAPLTDAALTPYHAIRRSWSKMTPTSTVVVIGVGGLGHLAVQLVNATTAARVIAVDNRTESLELAKKSAPTMSSHRTIRRPRPSRTSPRVTAPTWCWTSLEPTRRSNWLAPLPAHSVTRRSSASPADRCP